MTKKIISVLAAITLISGAMAQAAETVQVMCDTGEQVKTESRMVGDILYTTLPDAKGGSGVAAFYDENNAIIEVRELNINPDNNECRVKAPQYFETAKFYVWCSSASKTESGKSAMFTAPNTTAEMCNADHWLKKRTGTDQIIMTPEEIETLNREIIATKGTNTYDLANEAETFDGISLLGGMTMDMEYIESQNNYINGELVSADYFAPIKANIPKESDLQAAMQKQYGYCVNRTVMKSMPYDEFISDAPTDPEWDNWVLSAVAVNEPIVAFITTVDGEYTYIKSRCCYGWVPTEDIALCENKAEWEAFLNPDEILVVTGEKVYLEASADKDLSEKMLTMGTVLPLVTENPGKVAHRLAWNNYIVKMPARADDGSFYQKDALISANRDVNIGYLPYTQENILKQAFKALGNRYGWGGMLNAPDCSAFAKEVYKCFGFDLARNTNWQAAMPVKQISLKGMTDDEKKEILDEVPLGAILQFPGHEMIYIGENNDLYYTINDVSSLVDPTNPDGGVVRPRSVIVNDLSTLRANKTTWLSNLDNIIVIDK